MVKTRNQKANQINQNSNKATPQLTMSKQTNKMEDQKSDVATGLFIPEVVPKDQIWLWRKLSAIETATKISISELRHDLDGLINNDVLQIKSDKAY